MQFAVIGLSARRNHDPAELSRLLQGSRALHAAARSLSRLNLAEFVTATTEADVRGGGGYFIFMHDRM